MVGESAAMSNTTGSYNVALGWNAGFVNSTGNANTFLGNHADALIDGLNNATAIGSDAIVATANTMILGTSDVNVGIGLSGNPLGTSAKFDVQNDATSTLTSRNIGGAFQTFGTAIPSTSYWGIRAQSFVKESPWNNFGGDFEAWNCKF